MPLETNLNVSPYFDDYDQDKEFYRILFRPGQAVQTRELNQLQTILQNQIERFGDHVFKSGTIVSGVNFSYLPTYNFIKILDDQEDGQPALPSSYVGYFIKSNLNLTARVVNYADGLESQSPNLKTLYLQYINSSDKDSANANAIYTSFSADQSLTIFSKNNELFDIDIVNGGQGFSNSDNIVIQSAIKITGNTIAFSNGEVINSSSGSKSTIVAINTTAIANTIILALKPLTSHLLDPTKTEAAWTFTAGQSIVGNTSTATATVSGLVGSGAEAILTTDALGILQSITVTSGGSGYDFNPVVTVQSANATATVNDLELVPQNYKAIVTVSNTATTPTGTGYAFAVTEGIIYQKGFFLRVEPQTIIVDKYTASPDDVAVGFKTVESFVNYNVDTSLFDNATGTINYAAPGADRLKLTPVLTKMALANAYANVDFFALAEWKQGQPYKENRTTVYNTIGDELARRTREAQGNFVADPFQITTKEKSTLDTANVQVVIDPGLAYISGYRVATSFNNYINVARSTTTTTVQNQQITANYGNYIYVKELVGLFDFKTGSSVSLRSAAATKISSVGFTISAPGSEIGTARVRSLVLDSGTPGTASAVYRMYLFDITMSTGYSFRDVRSVYSSVSPGGVADLVLVTDTTSGASIAVVNDVTRDRMVFPIGSQPGVKAVSDISFTYRTVSNTTAFELGTGGTFQISLATTDDVFPYSDGALSDVQKRDFVIFPVDDVVASANIAGTVVTNTSNTLVVGTSTTFTANLNPGDFIKIANSADPTGNVYQIATISNATHLNLTTTPGSAFTSANAVLYFPKFYPIALEGRSNRTISISASGKTADFSVGVSTTAAQKVVVGYNRRIGTATPRAKTVTRNQYVKIRTANNAAGNAGPWSLGVPGMARLKNVYIHDDTGVVNTNSLDVTKYFYIDNNDDENVYRPAKLTLLDKSAFSVNSTAYLLVKYDYFSVVDAGGFFTVDSYTIDDTANLASIGSSVNTFELPEVVTRRGEYVDLRDAFDFRPYANTKATITGTVASATVNPLGTVEFTSTDKLFPAPDSAVTYDVEFYNLRVDTVTVDKNGTFDVVQGTPSLAQPTAPPLSPDVVILSQLYVPPYPSVPAVANEDTQKFLARRMGNSKGMYDGRRASALGIRTRLNKTVVSPQPIRYTMSDIGRLERRINELEYAVALSRVEAQIRDLVIPSSITPTVNRFKNAFFVDSFNDYEKASVQSREFAATIDLARSQLKPAVGQLNYQAKFDRSNATTNNAIVGSMLLLPYTEEVLINQTIRSAVVSPPTKVQYSGSGTITPPSFEIQIRGEGGADIPSTTTFNDWGNSIGAAGLGFNDAA